MTEFEIIKTERAFLASLEKGDAGKEPVSKKTLAGYGVEFKRLVAKAGKPSAIIEEAGNTKSAATWYRRRAAILCAGKMGLSQALKAQDQLQRAGFAGDDDPRKIEWQKKVREVGRYAFLIREAQVAQPPSLDDRKKRVSKKRSLAGLPDDWRQTLAARLPKYRLAFLVAAASGCRPDELEKGVSLSIRGDGRIMIHVQGAKVTGKSGQPDRTIKLIMDGIDGSISSQLAAAIESGVGEAKIESAKLFSGAVRDAGRREWPNKKTDLSAYSLRHQFSADLKGAGFSPIEIASLMGHVTTKTASYYGDPKQARGGLQIDKDIDLPLRQVKQAKEPSSSPPKVVSSPPATQAPVRRMPPPR